MERPLTALVVDSSEPIRALLTAFLSGSGFAVDSAGGMDAAIAKLRCCHFDVLVVDPATSGDGDGISRLASDFPEIVARTVVISAPPQRPIAHPVHSVIAKPFELERLLEAALGCCLPRDLHRP
jgi:CheY-like chemotaxis protein